MVTSVDINVKSLGEAIERVAEIAERWDAAAPGIEEDPYLWFRGVNSCKHQLIPGAYWRDKYDERKALVELAQRGGRFNDSNELGKWNSWGTYYLAQHYGIPTRLLDWSESFVSSLFFAFDGVEVGSDPCVWIIDPGALNDMFFGWNGIISPENNSQLEIWLPKGVMAPENPVADDDDSVIYDNSKPIAIFPKHENSRIRSQSGFFTVHGSDRSPIDEIIVGTSKDPAAMLARVCFRSVDVLAIKKTLGIMGVRRSAIYPDLDNFAKELKEIYKWK